MSAPSPDSQQLNDTNVIEYTIVTSLHVTSEIGNMFVISQTFDFVALWSFHVANRKLAILKYG
jgi:hypothetical protein